MQRYLRVAINCNLPPFQFLDASGQCVGMHIQMLDAIAQSRGYVFDYIPLQTNRECLEALQEGKADVIAGMIEGAADTLGYQVRYTEPLTASQLCVVVQNDLLQAGEGQGDYDTRLYTAVFSADTARYTLLANLRFNKYIVVGNQSDVVERQREESDMAMIGIKDSLLYQLDQLGILDDYAIRNNYLGTIHFTLAVRPEDGELLRSLNSIIDQFRVSTQYEDIYNRWIVVADSDLRAAALRQVGIAVGIAAVVLLGYGWATTQLRNVLKKRVAQQTQQIQTANQELERQLTQIQDENDLRNRIIKYSPNAMLLFDENHAIVLTNKSAQVMAGTEEMLGRSILQVPVFCEIVTQLGRDMFLPDATIENRSIRLEIGTVQRSYRCTTHQVHQYGRISGILLTVQDITEEEQAQQAAFESEKNSALMRIAAGIAHEIRNPLMSIRTFASLIGSRGNDREVQESFAHYVPNEVDRINRLIESLIHYAKPTSRRVDRILVSELVEEALYLANPLIKAPAQFIQELDPSLYITADRDQVKQMVINLLMNSVEATNRRLAESPCAQPLMIYVRAQAEGEWARITVRDEGVGMTPAEIAQCTEPFFTTKDNGTGLGLALIEQDVGKNGGHMSIESEKGVYTQITLRFRRNI
ncbi:MAG: transporter substrate-binding domain-containing protein [Christensenellaceae bacterium]|nr:transporter substrate-binding domain-containing protein [Christensenellaceae bacterium]